MTIRTLGTAFIPSSLKAGDDLQIQFILRENLSSIKQLKDLYNAFQESFLKSNSLFPANFLNLNWPF